MLKHGNSSVNLGGNNNISALISEIQVNSILEKIKKEALSAYVLNWKGGKIPYGAEIGGHKVGWTQNGIVSNEKGEMIGTYDRLMEWGGEDKNEHCMIVFI